MKMIMDINVKKINLNTLLGSMLALLILLIFIFPGMQAVLAFTNREGTMIKRGGGQATQTNAAHTPKKKKKKTSSKKVVPQMVAVKASIWGGEGVIFEVKDKSVTIQYGCADGQIEQALMKDGQGNFSVNGFHIRQGGGPVLINAQPVRQNVRYEGKITGDKMRLKVTLTESKEIIGEFILQSGNIPEIIRCY